MQVALLDLVCVKQYSIIHCLTLLNIEQSPILYLYCWHLLCHLEFIISSNFILCWRTNFPSILLLSSVQLSRSVVSDSLQPHGLQHARHPCPSLTLGGYSNSCPLIRWFHRTISSSVIPFSSCPQSFPASGSFPMSQFFASGGQVLEFQLQHQSFQWISGTEFL